MKSFDHTVTQESNVKSEVSDAAPSQVCEQSDDESLLNPAQEDGSAEKRSPPAEDEQDLSLDSNTSGSPLPPRKRAKTQEEKEQRRVERIMRNRQAAHASREKKRKHLEMLEGKCTQLESENLQLKNALSQQNQLRARLEQLEAAVRLAKSSGDVASLDSVASLPPHNTQTDFLAVNGTVAGTVVGASPLQEPESAAHVSGATTPNQVSGSPAPSLEDDCASPEALFIKNEEDLFPPYSPENNSESLEDPFGINLSFDSSPATTDNSAYPDSSSKSRHPAVLLTPLSEESVLMDHATF